MSAVGLLLFTVLACSRDGSSRSGLLGSHGDDDTATDPDVPGDDTGVGSDDTGADDSGIPALDEDHDGYPSTLDCDDSDPDVYPDAVDPEGDGIDQDCNGYDGPPLPSIDEIQVGDLIVTEILVHSLGVDDSDGEWFEIANVSATGFDLEGLQIVDGGSDSFVVGIPLALLPGETMVFGADADTATNGGVGVDYEYSGFTLDDESDAIVVSNGRLVVDYAVYTVTDDVAWDEAATRSLDPGHFDGDANDDARAWCAATTPFGGGELGTPGLPNDDCPALSPGDLLMGELVIDEVMTDPEAVADQYGQWFEIYNASSYTVNLEGLVVRVDSDSYHLTTAFELASGGYAVIATDDDTAVNGGVNVDVEWPAGPTYQLSISDGELSIENDSFVLDGISWENGFPETTGASMSLDPTHQNALDNDDGANWCAATVSFGDGDYGTPGTGNGC
jgi:uncharacterized protein